MNRDEIQIKRLNVRSHIGVPDEERANPQDLWISVSMWPSQSFSELRGDVLNTVDYFKVSLEISKIASEKPRHLIETLAVDVADQLLSSHPLFCVEVEVEKRILPNADFVAVKIRRSLS